MLSSALLAALLAGPALFAEPYAGPFEGTGPLEPCVVGFNEYALPEGGCARFRRAEALLGRLASAAGFKPGEIRLELGLWDHDPGAAYSLGGVRAAWGLLERFGDDEEVLVLVLSHELGHAEQERDGLWPEWRYAPKGLVARQIEAHADLRGARLAQARGFGLERRRLAFERFFASVDRSLCEETATHPSSAAREENLRRLHEARGRIGESPAEFDEAGRLKG